MKLSLRVVKHCPTIETPKQQRDTISLLLFALWKGHGVSWKPGAKETDRGCCVDFALTVLILCTEQ